MYVLVRNFQIKKYPATSCGGRHLVGNWLRASSPAQRPSPAGEGRCLCYKMDNLFVGNPLMCRCAMIRLFEYWRTPVAIKRSFLELKIVHPNRLLRQRNRNSGVVEGDFQTTAKLSCYFPLLKGLCLNPYANIQTAIAKMIHSQNLRSFYNLMLPFWVLIHL